MKEKVNYEEEFAKYDLTDVANYNKPDFENDSITVLQAKLENLDRIGTPKKGEKPRGNQSNVEG